MSSSDSCYYYSCNDCALGESSCVWDLDYNYCTNAYAYGYPSNYAAYSWSCPDDDSCSSLSSCENCVSTYISGTNCVWDTDYDDCVDTYIDSYPSNYASSSGYCSDCCEDYSSCSDCTNDYSYCSGNCVWDNDYNKCVNTWADGYPSDYSWYESECTSDTSWILSTVFSIFGVFICIAIICCCIYQQKKRNRRVQPVVAATITPAEGGNTATTTTTTTGGIKYVDQNGNPVAPPTAGANIKYVDQFGIYLSISIYLN